MSFRQSTVFRLYFNSESDVFAAQRQLANQDIRPDYIKAFNRDEPSKWKMIFAEEDFNKAKLAIEALQVKPVKADFYDYSKVAEGWGDFAPLE